MLGGSETCFKITLYLKMTSWEPKNILEPLNQDFYKHAIICNISKPEVGILKYHVTVCFHQHFNFKFNLADTIIIFNFGFSIKVLNPYVLGQKLDYELLLGQKRYKRDQNWSKKVLRFVDAQVLYILLICIVGTTILIVWPKMVILG